MSGVPGLEALRRGLILCLLEGDSEDHVAAALPGRHCIQQLALGVQHTDAGRAVAFVAGEHVEIGIQRAYIHRQTRCRLAAVQQHLRAGCMREACHCIHGHDMPRNIGDVCQRHQLRARRQAALERRQIEAAVRVNRRDDQLDADAAAQHLPRHNIRVMLHLRQHHLIAGLQKRRAPGLRHEVQPLRRAAHEYNLAGVACIEEAGDLLACTLEAGCSAGTEAVHAAMYVCIISAVEIGEAVDDRARLLRTRRCIQEHDARVGLEDRELAADFVHIQPGRRTQRWRDCGHQRHAAPSVRPSQPCRCFSRCADSPSPSAAVSITSAANASTSIARAVASSMPRAFR